MTRITVDKLSLITALKPSIFVGTADELVAASCEMSGEIVKDWDSKWDQKLGK